MEPEAHSLEPAAPTADPQVIAAVVLSSGEPALAPLPAPAPTPLKTIRGGEVPEAQSPPAPPVSSPVSVWLAKTLETRWEIYLQRLRTCQDRFSEVAVHDLRVATRRLVAELALLECTVPGTALEKARRELKRRRRALGELRDTHVQLLFLEQKTARFPELLLVRDSLRRRERRLVKLAEERARRFKNRKLQRWIDITLQALLFNAADRRAQQRRLAAILRAAGSAFAAVLKCRNAIVPGEPSTIHHTRMAFKRFRYMIESLSPQLSGLSRLELRPLAAYQRKMGLIQDLEVIQDSVAAFVREHPESEMLFGAFNEYLRRRRVRAVRSFMKTADNLGPFWPPPALKPASGSAGRTLRFVLTPSGSVQYMAGALPARSAPKPARRNQ